MLPFTYLNVQKNERQEYNLKNMKKTHFLIVIVFAIFTLSSCLKDDAQPTPQALVTLLNAYPDDTGIYYRMDGNSISQSNGDFKGLTYFRAFPGNRKLEILGRVDNKAIMDTTMAYADSIVYTGFVYGIAGKPKFIRTTDLPISDVAEKAAVRFIQLGNGIGKVTLKIGEQEYGYRNTDIPPGKLWYIYH